MQVPALLQRCSAASQASGRCSALHARPRLGSRAARTRRSGHKLPAFSSNRSNEVKTTSSPGQWQVPSLLRSSKAEPAAATVYTVRLTTSYDRGSALSEPLAGVNVCLIGEGGAAVMHRISPVNDPKDNMKAMEDICSLVGEESGADCASLGSADLEPAWPNNKEAPAKPRFQEGAVDEVSFMAPELGRLTAILLAPEGGSWVCDEVDVASSRTQHMDRFVCRKRLGGRKGEPAAYLTPVPPDAVVYGTGDAARIITREQAAALQAMSMADYGDLKTRLLLTTALLTVGGSGVAALASGMDAAVPFALGGVAGLLYQLLLQLGADAAVATAAAASPAAAAASSSSSLAADGLKWRLLKVFGSSAVRLLLVASAALVAVWALQDTTGAGKLEGSEALFQLSAVDAWQLGLGLCGFLLWKVAVLVSMAPPLEAKQAAAAQQVEKNA